MAASETAELEAQVEDMQLNGVEEDQVTPWDVTSTSAAGVDYDKLISKLNPRCG